MKRFALVGILFFAACRTTAAVPSTPLAPADAYAAVEASLAEGEFVERMHRSGAEYVALVSSADGESFRLVVLREADGAWTVSGQKDATADYLWPEQ